MEKKNKILELFCLVSVLMAVFVLFTACSKDNTISTNANNSKKETDSISIKYVGNSCFYIQTSDGTRIVTDPFGSGYASVFAPFPSLEADLVTVSHGHSDHNGGMIELKGKPKTIFLKDLNEPYKIGSLEITAYLSKHVLNMGNNTVFIFKVGNLKIVHMGETDKIDSPEALAAIKDADVLLAYCGDLGEVKNKDIFAFANQMNIKVVVPQHYSMDPEHLFYEQPAIDQVIKELPQDTEVVKSDELIVKEDMKKQFVILSPLGSK